MGRKFLMTNRRVVEKKQEQIRTPVVLFCLALVLTMVSIVMVPMFKKDSTPVLQNATPSNVRSHSAKMALVVGEKTNSESEVVEVVDKGASFNMVSASSNQPVPVTENEILARQKAAREAQKQQDK